MLMLILQILQTFQSNGHNCAVGLKFLSIKSLSFTLVDLKRDEGCCLSDSLERFLSLAYGFNGQYFYRQLEKQV